MLYETVHSIASMKRYWTPEEEAARLAERFEGVNQAAFAREYKVPGGASMVSQHIKGRRPLNMDAALAYMKGFGVRLEDISPRLASEMARLLHELDDWKAVSADHIAQVVAYVERPLLSNQSQEHLAREVAAAPYRVDGYVRLPVMGEAAAGPGTDPDSFEVVQYVEVLESWIRQTMRVNPTQLRVLTARGQSMKGVVEDGDVLFVLPCTEFKDDGLHIVTMNNLVRVKRLNLRVDGYLSVESMDREPELVPLSAVGDTVIVHATWWALGGLRSYERAQRRADLRRSVNGGSGSRRHTRRFDGGRGRDARR